MIDLELQDNRAILSDNLVSLLNAQPGDRIQIVYGTSGGQLLPSICVSSGGNKLTKSNSFACKGKEHDFLAQYGTKFEAVDDLGVIFLKGDQEFKVFTEKEKAVEHFLDMSILTDTNYNIQKFNSYTV